MAKKTLLVLIYQYVHKLTRARPFFFFFLRLTKYTISRSIFEPQKSITYQKNCIFSEHCQKLFLFREEALFIRGGGIGITADPGRNSYDPPLMTFSKPIEIPMTPPLNRISI